MQEEWLLIISVNLFDITSKKGFNLDVQRLKPPVAVAVFRVCFETINFLGNISKEIRFFTVLDIQRVVDDGLKAAMKDIWEIM